MVFCILPIVEYLLGRPDQSLLRARAAHEQSQTLSHLWTQLFMEASLGWALMFRRAANEAAEWEARSFAICTEQGFTELLAWGRSFRGWALIERDKARDGIAELTEGIATLDSLRDEVARTMHLGWLAEGHRNSAIRYARPSCWRRRSGMR